MESEDYYCLDCGEEFIVNEQMGEGKVCPDCESTNVEPVGDIENMKEDNADYGEDY